VSAHVDPRALEGAAGDARRAMLDHLRECAACRAAVAAEDPVALFALLAETPVPRRVLDEVSANVARRAGLDRASFGAVLASMPSIRLRLAAAAVAGLALVGVTTMLRQAPEVSALARGATDAPRTLSQRADVDVRPDRAVSQVVDFTVGDTQVVMVYNGDLKL
jgi:hypothetical protein